MWGVKYSIRISVQGTHKIRKPQFQPLLYVRTGPKDCGLPLQNQNLKMTEVTFLHPIRDVNIGLGFGLKSAFAKGPKDYNLQLPPYCHGTFAELCSIKAMEAVLSTCGEPTKVCQPIVGAIG